MLSKNRTMLSKNRITLLKNKTMVLKHSTVLSDGRNHQVKYPKTIENLSSLAL